MEQPSPTDLDRALPLRQLPPGLFRAGGGVDGFSRTQHHLDRCAEIPPLIGDRAARVLPGLWHADEL